MPASYRLYGVHRRGIHFAPECVVMATVASKSHLGAALAITALAGIAAVLSFALTFGMRAPRARADGPLAWQQWQHLQGVVDIVGPRADGRLVASARGSLFLIAADGGVTPFSAGNSYSTTPDDEPYMALAPALHVQSGNCDFAADDLFILDLPSPQGVIRVDGNGQPRRITAVPNVDMLNGIAFDTTGRFDHRLLITGSGKKGTTVAAIDCNGGVTTITDSAPPLEGGVAVAPASFGRFAGDLIAPDENTGKLWAIAPDGTATEVLTPNLPTGGDTGVESLGFVPSGFAAAGGVAYLSDRGTQNNPFPGTDSILRLTSADLASAGVVDGDLLVATEGNGTTVFVRCDSAGCVSSKVADGTPGGHIEGHLTIVPNRPNPA
jgi:hypothetical protein